MHSSPPYPGGNFGLGPAHPATPEWLRLMLRFISGGFGGAAAVLWLLCGFMVLSSRFSSNIAADPHGYGMIFGTLLAVPVGLVAAVLLPFVASRRYRAHTMMITLAVYLIGSAVLLAALFTA